MPTLGFSVLPYHMVWLVAKYVRRTNSELNMDDSGKVPVNPFVPLLHTCHNWRQVILPLMFGSGTIFISEGYRPKNIYAHYHSSILECIDQNYNEYMLKMNMDFDLCEAAHGTVLSVLSASNIGSFVFPGLKHITISVSHRRQTQEECYNATSNIRNLVQHICQMLPALGSITLRYISLNISMYISVNTHQHTNNLVDGLFETLSGIYLKNKALLAGRAECSLFIAGLTSLSVSWVADYSTVSNLIYANSQSLQKLRILYCVFEGIEVLVHRQDTEQEYMCYPRLTELYLASRNLMSENLVPPTGNTVVFPQLCNVYIKFEYPFSDDVLFRGNRWTLESIDIVLNTQSIMQLSLDGVFNKGNMLDLQNVVFRSEDTATRDASINSCLKTFFQGLLSSSPYIALLSQTYHDMLIGSIDCNTQYHSIICLHLGSSNVTFENIEVLLQALPRLTYLKSTISSLGDKYSGMSLPKVLKSMQATLNPLSKYFCTWSIHSLDTALVDLISTCIMLLIDQCPKFQTVVFNTVNYITPIKIHQQLVRTSPRMTSLYSRKDESLEFIILFSPIKAVVKIIHNSI